MPPGLQPPQLQAQHLGPGGPAGGVNNSLYGLAGHPAQLPPYAASPRYGDVSQLLNPQGLYSPQGALRVFQQRRLQCSLSVEEPAAVPSVMVLSRERTLLDASHTLCWRPLTGCNVMLVLRAMQRSW